jgi:hypothetical protein
VVMKNWEPLVSLPALAMPRDGQIHVKLRTRRVDLLTQLALLGVAQLEVLILELVAVDRLSASTCTHLVLCKLTGCRDSRTITSGKITTLDHEILDDTVEGRVLVAKALLASSQSAESGLAYAE